MSLIPPEQDFEDWCKDCEQFYVPGWTNCKCTKHRTPILLDQAMKKVDNEILRRQMQEKAEEIAAQMNPLPEIPKFELDPNFAPVGNPPKNTRDPLPPYKKKKKKKPRVKPKPIKATKPAPPPADRITKEEALKALEELLKKGKEREARNPKPRPVVVREYTEEEKKVEKKATPPLVEELSKKLTQDEIDRELDDLAQRWFD